MKIRFFILSLLLPFVVCAAVDTQTRIFDNSFRSLKVAVEGNDYAPPVVLLGGNDRIAISFDQISPDMQYLRYSVTHCDAEWRPSSILEPEYVDGFNEANIEDYAYSSGTLANYVHYSLTIPNDNMKLKLSGNYLLKVYPENDPDNPCFQARFSLYEDNVDVIPTITSRTDVDYNAHNQQLDIEVNTREYVVDNLYSDLKVRVMQNMREDNAVLVSTPLRVAGKRAFFERNRSLVFKAGNEFRRFEMVTTNYYGLGIDYYEFSNPYYHTILKPDAPRVFDSYIYDRTQYGRFTIRQSDAPNSDTDADYMIVHFRLDMPQLSEGNIYVAGEFSQNKCERGYEMRYNDNNQCYEADIFLKMGSYNYQYLWLPNGANIGLTETIEGDFYQTVNEYTICVYNRRRTERYDRLIGYKIVYSGT